MKVESPAFPAAVSGVDGWTSAVFSFNLHRKEPPPSTQVSPIPHPHRKLSTILFAPPDELVSSGREPSECKVLNLEQYFLPILGFLSYKLPKNPFAVFSKGDSKSRTTALHISWNTGRRLG